MKKALLFSSALLALAACGGDKSTSGADYAQTEAMMAAEPAPMAYHASFWRSQNGGSGTSSHFR